MGAAVAVGEVVDPVAGGDHLLHDDRRVGRRGRVAARQDPRLRAGHERRAERRAAGRAERRGPGALVGVRVGQHARRIRVGGGPRAVVRTDVQTAYASIGWPVGAPLSLISTSAASSTAVVGSCGPKRRIGQVVTQRRRTHRPRRRRSRSASAPTRPRNSRRPDPSPPAAACTMDPDQAALIAFLLTDPGEDLPRDLVLRPDLLVDPQEGWPECHGSPAAEGASPTPLPEHVPPITTVSSAAPPASSNGNRGRHHHEDADAAPAGHDRHRRSPLLHVAHQPAASPLPGARTAADTPRSLRPRWSPSRRRTRASFRPLASETTRGWRPRSAGVTWARSRDQLAAQPGRDRLHRPRARPAVREPQIRERGTAGDRPARLQIGRRHRRAHAGGNGRAAGRRAGARTVGMPADQPAARARLERQRRDRTARGAAPPSQPRPRDARAAGGARSRQSAKRP